MSSTILRQNAAGSGLFWRTVVALLLAFGFSAVSADAQVLYGSVVGNVTDNAGAAVAGATVTITNKGTNQSREVTTGEDGSFSFPAVQTGVWSVGVTKTGFKSVTVTSLE
ncbi:MAG: carboxypeptidase-like regulatory domain-containing protein, partial [Acidobacteriota bacterium]